MFHRPPALKGMQAAINVECESECFMCAVLSVLHYNDVKEDSQRMNKYATSEDEFKFDGLNVEQMDIWRGLFV